MKKALLLLLTCNLLSGCGFLLVDVPIRVPMKGRDEFVNQKFETKKKMYIIKYAGEVGYYMHSTYDPSSDVTVVEIPEGTIVIGSHISRVNGWPNGTFYHYVGKLEDWEIFQQKFVVQTKMDTNLFYPLNKEFFEKVN